MTDARSRRLWSRSARAALLSGLVAAVPGQRAAAAGERTGVVLDQGGAPVAGATVRVEVSATSNVTYLHHTLDVLARAPLAAATDAAGHFALRLTAAQRRLGTGHEPVMTLVIEAEGYQSWHEPLPFGLTGFHGTRAVLHRLTDADLHEVTVEDPPAGALLWVRRIDAGDAHPDARVLPVPQDGVVRVHAPLLPTPMLVDDWRQTRGLGHEVQLWAPGRSSAALRLDLRTRKLRIPAADSTARALRVLADGAPAAGVRGLYICPDAERRWFPARDEQAREDAALRLLAVAAAGRATALPDTGSFAPVELAKAAAGEHTIAVAIAGDAAPPTRVAAWLVPLEHWPNAARGRFLSGRGTRSVVVHGHELTLDLGDWQQHALVVSATGCLARVWPPLAAEVAPARIELMSTALHEASMVVLGHDDEPIAGAEVRLPLGSLTGRGTLALTTDGTGTCRLPLAAGRHEVLYVDEARCALSRVVIGANEPPPSAEIDNLARGLRLADNLERRREIVKRLHAIGARSLEGRPLRARLRTANGDAAAFAAVTIDSETALGERRTRKGFADAFGCVHAGYVGETATLTCRGVQVEQRALAGAEPMLLEFNVPALRMVAVELPADARIKRVSFWLRNGDVRHENLDLDTDRLLLGWRDDCTRCDVLLADGPPATVVADDLARGGGEVPFLARDRVVRTVPLHAYCNGTPVFDFEVRPVRPGGQILIYDQREGRPLRDGVWTARDRSSHQLRVFHRDYLPSDPVSVPASAGERDPALIVELVRGARACFRIVNRQAPARDQDISITVYDGGLPRHHVTLHSSGPAADDKIHLPLPFALAPGHYAADLRTGRESKRVAFVVEGNGEVLVDV